MKEKSIWEEVGIKEHNSLDKDIITNVLVIGGGITGILCAYELSKRGINVIVVEKNKIGHGTSKDTTAFITAQHETLYQDLIKRFSKEKAKEYLEINLKSVSKYKELSLNYDFDFKECTSTLYSKESKEIIFKEKEALDSLGYETELIDKIPLNFEIKAGITFKNQGILNPLKLINALAKELIIYEHTEIISIRGNKAYTSRGKIITFKDVIITTHYPFVNKKGLYFAKLTQRRSYVAAIEHEDIEGTYCSVDPSGLYFRSYNKHLIVGGNDRDNKKICHYQFIDKVKELYPNKEIKYYWSGQDCISLDGVPYIGRYSMWHDNYYVATGFNLWGFTWAMASSFILADMIEGKKTFELTSPRRWWINKELLINLGTTIKSLATFKTPRCTHMGSSLTYNKKEDRYECPCHGSRFDKDGRVVDGPANKNLQIKKN